MKNISRRRFIGDTAKSTAVLSSSGMLSVNALFNDKNRAAAMPVRTLGKTGLEVSVLSFGGGSQFLKNKNGVWEQLLEEAVESGIHIFDSAPNYDQFNVYKDHLGAEEKLGAVLPAYRNKVLISTKLETRDSKKVKEQIDRSLSRLKTDYIDILMLHGLSDSDNVDEIAKGVYKEMQSLKKAGIVRFIGFSSMNSAARSQEMLEKLDIDVAMMAFNPTRYGNYWDTALPAARKQNTGVIAMKVMRYLVGEEASPEELFSYGMSLDGVASIIIGHVGKRQLRDNIHMAQRYAKDELAYVDHRALEIRLAPFAGPHKLGWARPEYTDGVTFT